MIFGNVFQGVLTSITDSLVLKVAELEGSNFGKIRVWGTIGWGSMMLLIGWLNELDTRLLPRYVPGLLLFVLLGLMDAILVLASLRKMRMQHRRFVQKRPRRPTLQETIEQSISTRASHLASISQSVSQSGGQSLEHVIDKERLSVDQLAGKQPADKQICKFVWLTCRQHPILLKHLLICVVIGMLTALHWNYFPLFLEEHVAKNSTSLAKNSTGLAKNSTGLVDSNFDLNSIDSIKNSNFDLNVTDLIKNASDPIKNSTGSALVGYASVVQCFAGEMPFMYFAELIVAKISLDASLTLVLLVFSFRYLLYSFFTNNPSIAYYILLVEVLHGVTFGLFYYCMNMLARDYSKKMFRVEFDYLMKNVYNRSDVTVETSVCEGESAKEESREECRQETGDKISIKLPEDDDSTFATMQGLLSASYEGFGVAIGSLVSGYTIHYVGFPFIWYLTSAIAFAVFVLDLLLLIVNRLRNRARQRKE